MPTASMVAPALDLKDMTFEELQAYVVRLGLEPYRARQIFQWLYPKRALRIEQMSSLSLRVREKLAQTVRISRPAPDRVERPRDGTQKFRLTIADGYGIASALIPE